MIICRRSSCREPKSALFRMPVAGTHRLNIEGIGVPSGNLRNGKDTANLTTHVDGVSIVKVDEAAQTAPTLPSKVRIDIAEGARLALDYPGTNRVRGVWFGGVSADAGRIVDAASYPDYVSGIGALEIVPSGSLLLFR